MAGPTPAPTPRLGEILSVQSAWKAESSEAASGDPAQPRLSQRADARSAGRGAELADGAGMSRQQAAHGGAPEARTGGGECPPGPTRSASAASAAPQALLAA